MGINELNITSENNENGEKKVEELIDQVIAESMQKEVNTVLFDEKLKNFSEKYLDEDLKSRKFTEWVDKVDEDKITTLFSDSKNRKWLKAFFGNN